MSNPIIPIFITFCAYPAWNDYNVRAINNIEGLPDKHVNQILQDSDGFMWFATNNGLCRYDGYEFKTYKSSSQFPELLQSNIVNAIVEDIDQFTHYWKTNREIFGWEHLIMEYAVLM